TEARLHGVGSGSDSFPAQRSNLAGLLSVLPGSVDIVFAHLGVSSMQLDDPARGFPYKDDGPLDLRMNPQRGRTAASLLENLEEPALAELLAVNADEPDSERMAHDSLERPGS